MHESTTVSPLPDSLLAQCQLPDYQHSLANLAARLHGNASCPPLAHPALGDLEDCSTVILLLIDGMGCAQLNTLVPGGWLQRQQCATLSSVFPSTTTAAITTLMTGLPPSQHSLLAWHVWAPEAGCIATPLPLRSHWASGEVPDSDTLAARLYSRPSALQGQGRQQYVLQPQYIADSHYSRHHGGQAQHLPWRSYDELFASLGALAATPQRKFVYAYIPDLDSLMHGKGTTHPKAQALLARLQQHCAELAATLPASCKLVITADHGQMDIPPERLLFLNDYPALAALLRQPLSGEPRAAICHVKPGMAQAFRTAFEHTLGHIAWCLPAADVIAHGWFGPPPHHPLLGERAGDFVLLMKDNWGLLHMVNNDEKRPPLLGNHGGLSAAEMQVPLIVCGS